MQKIVIEGGRPLHGTVKISGSKNATLPLMAAALLGSTPTTITNVPRLRDIETMAEVLRSLGADITFEGNTLRIDPATFTNTTAPYDTVRKMRASIYVMGPMLAKLREARVSLPGGCAIGPRPVDLHLRGFEALGASITLEHGYIVASADKLHGAEFNLSGPAGSSVGATCNVLMAAALADGHTTIHGAAREPDVIELVNFLTAMGARITGGGDRTIHVDGVPELRGIEHRVVNDRIESGTFMTAAAITQGNVFVEGAPTSDMDAVLSKLREIGVVVEELDNGVRINAENAELHPTTIQTYTYPGFPTDMQAQFMALLAIANGTSIIKEGIYVDRFMHAPEMVRMGARINVQQGMAIVEGVAALSGAPVMASDLRASAALVVAGLAASGITVVNRIYHIDRGYEAIEQKLSALGAIISRQDDDSTSAESFQEANA